MQYDEVTYGEKIKEKGFQGDNIKKELIILSKYLYHIDKLKPKQHKEFIYKFCERYIYDFNEVKHYKIIDACIRKGRDKHKHPIMIKSIPVYEEHLRKIDSYDVADDYKKVMLSMLIEKLLYQEKKSQELQNQQDFSFCYFSSNKTNKTIYNSSRIGSTYKIKNVLRDLNQVGVIHDIGRNRIILEFAQDVDVEKLYYEIQSKDFDKIGWVWDLYKKEKSISVCEDCNSLIKRKLRSKTTRCSACQKKKDKEDTRIRVAKHRCNGMSNS